MVPVFSESFAAISAVVKAKQHVQESGGKGREETP